MSDASGRCTGDSGAVIAEFALAMPMIAILALGLLDFGLTWRNANIVDRAINQAGRTGSSLANAPLTDYEVLRSLDASSSGFKGDTELELVVIYKSQTADGDPPSTCVPATVPTDTSAKGVSGVCNIYSAAQIETTSAATGFPPGNSTRSTCSGGWDAAWCPLTRTRALPNPDYMGIHVQIRHQAMTSIIPGGETVISRSVVYSLEPEFTL